jgi:shikimate kinase
MPATAPLQNHRIDRPVMLVGLMGVGKTTIGKRLANRLQLDFVDADHEIEVAAGHSISEIFERFGEAHFRDGERRVISRLIEGRPRIIATGGGAFMNNETRALMQENAVTVWIDANIKTLAERVARKDNRPLLAGKNAFDVLSDLAKIRNPIYAEAHIHVTSSHTPHDMMVDQIIEKLPWTI